PMFADEVGLFGKRSRANIRDIVAGAERADDDDPVAPHRRNVGFSAVAGDILLENRFEIVSQNPSVVPGQTPVDIKVSASIHVNGSVDAAFSLQKDSVRQHDRL